MMQTAIPVSDRYTVDFREEVRRLSATTKRYEKAGLAQLAANLLPADRADFEVFKK